VRALAAKVRYVIDPANEYPRNYTGHLRVTRMDGRIVEAVQPHLRGGKHEPLTDAELEAKFLANARFGGLSGPQAQARLAALRGLFEAADLEGLGE
jgi:2-methylcitrate dehydratase PrpD